MLRSIRVVNFRNLDIAKAHFASGFTTIVGDNGQGKTNLLEAIYLLAYGKSFRDDKNKAINWKKPQARVVGEIESDTIEITLSRDEVNKIRINNKPKKFVSLLGKFVCVLFHPQEIEIVSGAPSLRRAWLDRLIATTDKNYLHNLVNYQRTLQNRNRLLKLSATWDKLEVWDKSLARLGAKIWETRQNTTAEINEVLKKESVKLTGKLVTVEYENPLVRVEAREREKGYLKLLLGHRELDKRLKVTVFGPHRDDFKLIMAQKEAQTIVEKELSSFGSRAEQRQAILLLKIVEATIFSQVFGETPTILLDDVASELDEKNRERLLERLYAKQIILTTTNLDFLPGPVKRKSDVMIMKDGQLQRA